MSTVKSLVAVNASGFGLLLAHVRTWPAVTGVQTASAVPLPIIRLIAKTETKNAGGANAAERPYLSDEPARLCSLGAMVL